MHNRLKDERFLKACFDRDQKTLDLWAVLYWPEVEDAVKIVVWKETTGRPDPMLVISLVVDCTDQIYRQWKQIPSRWFDLKTQVRNYAFRYTKKYFASGGRASTP